VAYAEAPVTRIVTDAHHYKRPPRKRKTVAGEWPAIGRQARGKHRPRDLEATALAKAFLTRTIRPDGSVPPEQRGPHDGIGPSGDVSAGDGVIRAAVADAPGDG
jgi:hypothetical protein